MELVQFVLWDMLLVKENVLNVPPATVCYAKHPLQESASHACLAIISTHQMIVLLVDLHAPHAKKMIHVHHVLQAILLQILQQLELMDSCVTVVSLHVQLALGRQPHVQAAYQGTLSMDGNV